MEPKDAAGSGLGFRSRASRISERADELLRENTPEQLAQIAAEIEEREKELHRSLVKVLSAVEEVTQIASKAGSEAAVFAFRAKMKHRSAQGAKARHEKDPKTTEKSFVLECWRAWQRTPMKYKGKAAFSRDMLDKCQHLESQKKIEDWCREWEKSEPC